MWKKKLPQRLKSRLYGDLGTGYTYNSTDNQIYPFHSCMKSDSDLNQYTKKVYLLDEHNVQCIYNRFESIENENT